MLQSLCKLPYLRRELACVRHSSGLSQRTGLLARSGRVPVGVPQPSGTADGVPQYVRPRATRALCLSFSLSAPPPLPLPLFACVWLCVTEQLLSLSRTPGCLVLACSCAPTDQPPRPLRPPALRGARAGRPSPPARAAARHTGAALSKGRPAV